MGDQPEGKFRKRKAWLTAAGIVGAAAAAISIIALPTPQASAATDFCGRQINEISPGVDGIAALQELTAQGENQVIHNILRGTGLGPEWCGTAQFVMDVGAEVVVGGVEMHIFRVETPLGADILIAVGSQLAERLRGDQPAELPNVGPSGPQGVWAPVAWTGSDGVNIRPRPDTTQPPIGGAPEGAALKIECATYGEMVTGGGGTSNLWDRVTYNGVTGYVTDTRVNTGTGQPIVPIC
jgi:hypothetical protein